MLHGTLLVALFAVGEGAKAECPPHRAFGVAMVPYMSGAGDPTEQLLYEIAGVMPGIDQVFVPKTPWEMFGRLIQLKKAGREVDLLVIMGHGARDNPSVLFSGGSLLPRNVNVRLLESELRIYEEAVKKKRQAGEDSSLPQREVAERRTQLRTLEALAGVMARDARVLLFNCSPAATPEGRVFLHDLGAVLLGRRGGALVASRTDITLNEVMMPLARFFRLLTNWEWVPSGEVTIRNAKFVTEVFNATNALRPSVTPTAKSRGEVGELMRLNLDVSLDGLEAEERVEVCQKVNVSGPEGGDLPLQVRTLVGPNPKAAGDGAIRPTRTGSFAWNYQVESRHFPPMTGRVPFVVVAATADAGMAPTAFVKRPFSKELSVRMKQLAYRVKKAPTTAATLDERLRLFREFFETMEANDRRALLGATDFQVIERAVRNQGDRAGVVLDRMLAQFRLVLF